MSLEQRLTEKLRPHADRVAEGRHNEFDFLPAALLHGLERGKGMSEAVTELRAAFSTKVSTLEQHLADVGNSQKEISEQVVEALDAQRRVILAKFDAIDKYLHEAAKQQSENKALLSELSVLVQRRLDRAVSDFEKQIGKLSDALDKHAEHVGKRHRASQTILYACLIFVVLTLVASVALLIKR